MSRPLPEARLVGVGVFVLAGLLLLTVGLFMIGDRQMAFARKLTIYTEFTKITGLEAGSTVRVSGAKAGSVKQILPPARPSEKFRVRLELSEDLHPLVRTDSVASIETEGLVGGSYLGISIGSEAATPVAADGTIAGREPFELTDLMQQMSDTVQKVNRTIDATSDDLEKAVVSIKGAADGANALIAGVSDDLESMARSGRLIGDDASAIVAGIRSGKGSLGKFVNDDEVYERVRVITQQAQEVTANANEVIAAAKKAVDGFQSKDGPVEGMAANVKRTMDDTRAAMARFADNMEALQHNFLLRGFFKRRGYFDLARIPPADYRRGVLTKGSDRDVVRMWGRSELLFELSPDAPGEQRLTDAGKAWANAAIAPYLPHLQSAIIVLEGYAQQGTPAEQYLESRARALIVLDYLAERFDLDRHAVVAMALGGEPLPGTPRWDGVALAVILPKDALSRPPRSNDR